MLAIGGAIGVGLFLGSSVTIRLAGPGVLVAYAIGACVALIVAYALAEMAVVQPVAGGFGVYAETYLNRWAGFSVRATYAFIQIVAIGAEVTAAGIYFAFWFPAVPQWIWVVSVSAALIAINSLHVGRFGEFEYWFALIKVVAIVAFIVAGIGLIAGIVGHARIALPQWASGSEVLPFGWKGVWLALSLTLTSYMGIEIIAVTAGEAQEPEQSIPRAMRGVVLRLILFYVLAIAVILAISPARSATAGIAGSPFVEAFSRAGIPYAALIMNLVVITAALSSANTNIYLTTRMLYSLGRTGDAPAALSRLNRSGVPVIALACSCIGMATAILLAIFSPSRAFLSLYGVAVGGMLFVWIVILGTHLAFRKRVPPQQIAALPMRLRLFPASTLTGIAALLAISASTFYVPGLRHTIPSFILFLVLISLLYGTIRRVERRT